MRFVNILYGAIALALSSISQAQEEAETFQDLIEDNKNLTRFRETLETYTELYEALSIVPGLTVLAPSNEAFEKLENSPLGQMFSANDTAAIRNVLDYHVLNGTFPKDSFNGSLQFPLTYMMDFATQKITPGQKVAGVQQAGGELVFISGLGSRCSVTEEDLKYNTGILHVIDNFLIPPQPFTNTSLQFNVTAMAGGVIKSKLGNYFDNTRDVTIFAPNNAAFQRIGSVISTMNLEELGRIMKYHIINGTVAYSNTMPNNTILRSAQGGNLTIIVDGNSLFVNSAKILQQDLLLSNGVLHIIDSTTTSTSTGVESFASVTDAASATGVTGEEDGASSTTTAGGASSTSVRSDASSLPSSSLMLMGGSVVCCFWTAGFLGGMLVLF
ncbi:MAG: hypothetical protein M1823_005321 [Watsoniomyces obsoletus]|nr:MAG: hypothetical protein M1823_005321 [Watsoniomyces obsoletus]